SPPAWPTGHTRISGVQADQYFQGGQFMVEKTCAACDCDLDANSIKVKIGGKSVEVCCDECARKLKEAHAYAAAPSEGRDMDGDKIAASAHAEQPQIARPIAALLTGVMVIGFYLSAMTPARADTNASVMTSNQMFGQMFGQTFGQLSGQ